MLKSYAAELNGTELTWLDQLPANLSQAKVLVIVDDADLSASQQTYNSGRYEFTDLAGKLEWRGDAVSAQRTQRDAW